jgi:hypothetical protein
MLEKFVASLNYSQPTRRDSSRHLPSPAAVLSPQPSVQEPASIGVEVGDVAAPAESMGPPSVANISAPQSSPLELALHAPPRVGQSVVQDDDETPTSREAARSSGTIPG